AGEHNVGFASTHTSRHNGIRLSTEADVTEDRATLLAETGHVIKAGAVPLQPRRQPQNGTDRDDPGATSAGDDHIEASTDLPHFGLRQWRVIIVSPHRS